MKSIDVMYSILFTQGVGPQEYTLIKMKVIEPYPEKLKCVIFLVSCIIMLILF